MGRAGMALGLAGVLSGAYLAWCPVKDWRSQNNDLTEAFSSAAFDSIVNVLHYAYRKKLRASRTCPSACPSGPQLSVCSYGLLGCLKIAARSFQI